MSKPDGHAAADAPGKRVVLVAEDDAGVRKVLGSALNRAGYEVLLTRNAAEALGVLEGAPVDLLIADVILPDMSGPALAEACRRVRPQMRVIFISGYGDDVLQERGFERLNVLEKPFSPGLLRLRVAEALADR